jgi:hypothetical protein
MWLARAVDGEGGAAGDVIWAYLLRLALPGFRRMTLSQLVQGHSQAINPDWSEGGRFCAPGGPAADQDTCSPERLARRAINRAKSWEALSAATRTAITQLDSGQLLNAVPRAVDFATRNVSERFIASHAGAEISVCRGNCFIVTAESRLWPDGFVQIGPSSRLFAWGLGIGAVATVAGLGWLVWRS